MKNTVAVDTVKCVSRVKVPQRQKSDRWTGQRLIGLRNALRRRIHSQHAFASQFGEQERRCSARSAAEIQHRSGTQVKFREASSQPSNPAAGEVFRVFSSGSECLIETRVVAAGVPIKTGTLLGGPGHEAYLTQSRVDQALACQGRPLDQPPPWCRIVKLTPRCQPRQRTRVGT